MINVLGREVAALETFEQQFKELSWNHDDRSRLEQMLNYLSNQTSV